MNQLNSIGAWLLGGRRFAGRLAPWALTIALTMSVTLLLNGSHGAPLHAASAGQQSQASQAASVAHAARIARADAHIEALVNGDDLEINLTISQTENDCQASLSNGVCLRYTVVSDERPVFIAYGVIPLSAIHVSQNKIVLRVDPSKVAGFTFVMGAPALINVTWQVSSGAQGALQRCAVEGSIGAYTFASATTTTSTGAKGADAVGFAGKASTAGVNIIATIYMR